MRHRPTLTIPKPCHETWQTMTPAAQGRHCTTCDTVVVDFTRMTDAEVLAYVGQSGGASCGRFRQEQLGRPLVVPLPESGSSWRRRLLAIAAVLGLGTAAAPEVQAQQASPVHVPHTITMGMVAQPVPSVAPTLLPPLVVRGVVLDSATHEPLPGVTVLVKGTQIGINSNLDGSFELQIPAPAAQPLVLRISDIGYESQEVPVSSTSSTVEVRLTLNLNASVMGLLVVRQWYTPRGLWQRLKRPFQRW